MNDQTPDLLDRMLADLPVRPAPLDGLLRAGQRARHRRRTAAVAGLAAATALGVAGMTIGLGGPTDQVADGPAAPSSTRPVDLPTNGWEPGDISELALMSGVLGLDDEGCVVLDHAGDGPPTYATWPAGYTAMVDADGAVRLHDAAGDEVARQGQRVRMGGGFGSGTGDPHSCLPSGAEVFHVQSDVAVAPRTAAGGPDAAGDDGPSPLLDGAGNERLPVGATAEVVVYAHCGLRFARIDGALWETDPVGNGSSPTGGDLLRGTASRTSADRAVFTYAGLDEPVVFRPAGEPDPDSVCY